MANANQNGTAASACAYRYAWPHGSFGLTSALNARFIADILRSSFGHHLSC